MIAPKPTFKQPNSLSKERAQFAPKPNKESTLTDPENEEWQTDYEPILADSPKEAERLCRQLAEERGLELLEIKNPSRKGGKRYVCKFGGFIEVERPE